MAVLGSNLFIWVKNGNNLDDLLKFRCCFQLTAFPFFFLLLGTSIIQTSNIFSVTWHLKMTFVFFSPFTLCLHILCGEPRCVWLSLFTNCSCLVILPHDCHTLIELSNEERSGGDVTSALRRRTIDDLEMNHNGVWVNRDYSEKQQRITLSLWRSCWTQVGEKPREPLLREKKKNHCSQAL